MEYAVLVNGENVEFAWRSPSLQDINVALGDSADTCNCSAFKVRTLYLPGYVAGSIRDKLPQVLINAWHDANIGKKWWLLMSVLKYTDLYS